MRKRRSIDLQERAYFACLDEGDGGLSGLCTSENIVLVDAKGRLRFYDGTSEEDISLLYQDIQVLLQEK